MGRSAGLHRYASSPAAGPRAFWLDVMRQQTCCQVGGRRLSRGGKSEEPSKALFCIIPLSLMVSDDIVEDGVQSRAWRISCESLQLFCRGHAALDICEVARIRLIVGHEFDLREAPNLGPDALGQLEHRSFLLTTDVDHFTDSLWGVDESQQGFHHIVYVGKRACLGSVPVDRYRHVLYGLLHKAWNHHAIAPGL